jgi:hypothetical protein
MSRGVGVLQLKILSVLPACKSVDAGARPVSDSPTPKCIREIASLMGLMKTGCEGPFVKERDHKAIYRALWALEGRGLVQCFAWHGWHEYYGLYRRVRKNGASPKDWEAGRAPRTGEQVWGLNGESALSAVKQLTTLNAARMEAYTEAKEEMRRYHEELFLTGSAALRLPKVPAGATP